MCCVILSIVRSMPPPPGQGFNTLLSIISIVENLHSAGKCNLNPFTVSLNNYHFHPFEAVSKKKNVKLAKSRHICLT